MLLHLALFLTFFKFHNDTLKLPIFNGRVQNESPKAIDPGNGLLIKSVSDNIVRSCTNGEVFSEEDVNSCYFITINKEGLYYSYGPLDSPFVSKGKIIYKGDPIGMLKREGADYNLSFIVYRV